MIAFDWFDSDGAVRCQFPFDAVAGFGTDSVKHIGRKHQHEIIAVLFDCSGVATIDGVLVWFGHTAIEILGSVIFDVLRRYASLLIDLARLDMGVILHRNVGWNCQSKSIDGTPALLSDLRVRRLMTPQPIV